MCTKSFAFFALSVSLVLIIPIQIAYAHELRASDGAPLEHWHLLPDPSGDDTLEVWSYIYFKSIKSGDKNPYSLDEYDFYMYSYLIRTEDFTADEQTQIANAWMGIYSNNIVRGSATKSYNCHGFTFFNGAFWLNDNPEKILAADYKSVTTPQVGGIIAYISEGLEIVHTGRILATDGTISGTTVRSKWGQGPLFDHRINESPYDINPYNDIPEGYAIEFYVLKGSQSKSNDTSSHNPQAYATLSTPVNMTPESYIDVFPSLIPGVGGVGGVQIPVDKFGLLTPYIGLALTIIAATAATAIYAKRVKYRKEE